MGVWPGSLRHLTTLTLEACPDAADIPAGGFPLGVRICSTPVVPMRFASAYPVLINHPTHGRLRCTSIPTRQTSSGLPPATG